MDGLELALGLAALLAGLTGTWSPCGFSMIETLGPTGHIGGRATTIAACVTFTLGALVCATAAVAALCTALMPGLAFNCSALSLSAASIRGI